MGAQTISSAKLFFPHKFIFHCIFWGSYLYLVPRFLAEALYVPVSSFLAPGIFYVMLNSKIQAYLMGTTDLSWYHYSPCFLRISLFSWVQLKTFGSLHRRYTRGSYSNFTSDIKVVVSPSNFMSSIQCVNFIIIVINYQFVVVWSFVVYTMKFWFSAPAITYYFKQAPPSLELNILFHFFRWISEIDAPLK